jgi:hypothetical protein
MAEQLNPQPLPPGEMVRVYVPSRVAYNLEAMQKVTASVLDRLGCGQCHSGRILNFQSLDTFVVGENLDVRAIMPGEGF